MPVVARQDRPTVTAVPGRVVVDCAGPFRPGADRLEHRSMVLVVGGTVPIAMAVALMRSANGVVAAMSVADHDATDRPLDGMGGRSLQQ